MTQVYFPNEIFSNILSYCNDDIKTKHNKNQIKVNKQIIRISELIPSHDWGDGREITYKKILSLYQNDIEYPDEGPGPWYYFHFEDYCNTGGFHRVEYERNNMIGEMRERIKKKRRYIKMKEQEIEEMWDDLSKS